MSYQLFGLNAVGKIILLVNKIKMQQPGEAGETAIPGKQLRYRKFNLTGSTAMVYTVRNQKLAPKEFQFQGPKEKADMAINIKLIQADYYQKYKIDNGIKSLLRAYDQNRKRSSAEGMNRLGLDIIKIKSFSNSNTQKLTRSSDSAPKIPQQDSVKMIDHKIMTNREFLSPLKLTSIRAIQSSSPSKHEEETDVQTEQNINPFSQTTREGKQKQRRIFKKRAQDYLYRRLEGTQRQMKEEQNVVYDKHFLWKNMLSHNIYINLDLKSDDISNRPKKWKAYIAAGNNGAMIKGLIKRRFWWTISEQRTSDCNFVWTQLKIPELFQRQKRTAPSKPRIKNQQQQDEVSPKEPKGRMKLHKLKMAVEDEHLYKILNKPDQKLYKQYKQRYEQMDKQRDYFYKVERINKELTPIGIEEQNGLIHNHLVNNFYLGNKKALFYNLRQYYSLSGDNLYNYIPLTFHIRHGLKDPEYIKFVDYYKRRQRLIERDQRHEEEQGGAKHKMRNIWIVKPGENSNQGRGITVIDEIYQLNSLIKQGDRKTDFTSDPQQEPERTYIVQMYIDRPLLYNNRKFDIRHYMMISNFYGVTRAYWYEEGYIRTSSYEFDISNFEPEIHLTNDAVQKRYPDYHKYQPYNKISYEEFQRYLDISMPNKKYNFKEQILPQMKKMGTDAVRSVFTKISPGNLMNNFEIFGLDFMIDGNFKPWLIEINTNPCLECACPLLNRIIPYMAELSFKLTLDLAFPPPTHYPNTSKHLAPLIALDTFKYELIFDSQISGDELLKLYRRSKNNLAEQIGQIEDDEVFKDDGKECKLDDFT